MLVCLALVEQFHFWNTLNGIVEKYTTMVGVCKCIQFRMHGGMHMHTR